MIYNAKKWQNINRTNQESKYLQLMQVKNLLYCSAYILTETALLTFFLLYKTPSGYCTSFASQVRVTNELKSEFQDIYTKTF